VSEPIAGEGEPGLLESREVYRGRIVQLSVDRVRFPDGSTGELEMIRHRGAAAILPVAGSLDDADPDVLLLRQYRYAAGGHIYEVPAGMRDDLEESWEACARRELEEETGRRAGTLIPLTRIYTTPGFTDEVIHLFLAAELSDGEVSLDTDEFVEVVQVPLSTALEWVRSGRIVDAKTISTLLYAALFALPGKK
jgi:ADP-ribose pyrophosphatase